MKKGQVEAVEVDLIPYIDIVTLILLFLVIVGDMTKSASAVKMKLPKIDHAQSERKIGVSTEGRIVIQMKKESDNRYWAVVENHKYELIVRGENAPLLKFLNEQIDKRILKGQITKGPEGQVPFPVKLRIPEEAPMFEVERVIMTCARAGLVNVHYAAEKGGPSTD